MNIRFTNRLVAAYVLLIEAAETAEKIAADDQAAKQSARVTADPEAKELIRFGQCASPAGDAQLGDGK